MKRTKDNNLQRLRKRLPPFRPLCSVDVQDKGIIIPLLFYCVSRERPIPEWLRIAFIRAYEKKEFFEIDSWDQVFGPPCVTEKGRPARGKTRIAMQKKQRLVMRIYKRVEQLKAEGEPVDKKLFEKVAHELGVGRVQIEQIYYNHRTVLADVMDSVKNMNPFNLATAEQREGYASADVAAKWYEAYITALTPPVFP